ncbi:ATP-binding protein [uncultured Photobacterium sp.]|uniref:hybrid sensor histidine kinase/response regulator n=1 Tax=uncultured Photobacterium sp. TaxID=173973 RepID=UPI00260BA6DE|nr:ATP-binding protein [uncultured Photobacterium sp.]
MFRVIPYRIKPMLLASMLFVGIVPAFIYSWITSDKLSTIALTQISKNLSNRTDLAAQNIDDIITKRLLSIKSLANSPVFALNPDSRQVDHQFVSRYLSEITTIDTAFSAIYLLEKQNGRYIIAESSQTTSIHTLTDKLNQAGINQLDDITKQLVESENNVYISTPQQLDRFPFLYLITPVIPPSQATSNFSDSRLLVVKYELSELNKQLVFLAERINKQDYLILINQEGDVLLSGLHQGQLLQAFEYFRQIYRHENSNNETTSQVLHYTDRYDDDLIATVSRLSTRGNSNQPIWSLVSITPKDTVTHVLDYMHRFFLAALLLTAGIVIILSVALTKRITLPLAKLSRFAAQFRLGNYDRNDDFEGPHEFQVLHDALNQGADKISYDTQRLNRALHKAEAADRAKSAFLANLSHEIRTPMNGMLGLSQLLLKTKLTEKQEHHLRTLLDSGKHMMSLLNDILDFSKIEQGQLKLDPTNFCFTDLVGTIESTYCSLAKEKGIGFNINCEFNQYDWFYADKARIRQILFNLINNAIKFTEQGKVEVTLKLEKGSSPTELLLTIITSDTGIGIEPDRLQYIFDPFVQAEASTSRRFGGTGLGLSIIKQLAELMSGNISLNSIPGTGSTFTVTLSIHQGQYMQPEQESTEFDQSAFANLKVLIVEDNHLNVLIIDAFLKQRGFVTHTAENGAEALSILEQEYFDLILMDNHMPVMDGIEATLRIRGMNQPISQVPIFACTADVFEDTQKSMLNAGVDCVITKPLDERKLLDALQRFKHKITHIAMLRAEFEQVQKKSISQQSAYIEEVFTDDDQIEQSTPEIIIDDKTASDATFTLATNANTGETLDPANFHQIELNSLLEMMDNDTDIILQFLAIFADEHNQDVEKLREAIAQDDFDKAILISHSLKGASSSISALHVHQAAKDIEQKFKSGALPSEPELIKLKEALEKLTDEIHQQLDSVC